jgi:hypothetical protein
MEKDKARMPDGRVFVIHNIKIEERYRHPDYACTRCNGALSETGRIDIFELRSTKPDHPSFTHDIQRDLWIECPSARITGLRTKGVDVQSVGQKKYPHSRPFEMYAIGKPLTRRVSRV